MSQAPLIPAPGRLPGQPHRDDATTALRVGVAVGLCLVLIGARCLYTETTRFLFLPWNLLLAGVPMVFAWLAVRARRKGSLLVWVYGAVWLLFLPNAPYLVTDLIHLGYSEDTPILFDATILFSCALCGLAMGFISLRWMQDLVAKRWGEATGQVFSLFALSLAGFGIYLGRYLRWNSWDVIANPTSLLNDILMRLAHPMVYWHTWAVSLVFALLLICAYWLPINSSIAGRDSAQ